MPEVIRLRPYRPFYLERRQISELRPVLGPSSPPTPESDPPLSQNPGAVHGQGEVHHEHQGTGPTTLRQVYNPHFP